MADRFMTRLAVFVILRNGSGEILLQQRANTGYLDGYWDFPSGHVEYGESLPAAMVRETQEEVGVRVAETDLRLVHIDQYFLDKEYVNFIFEAAKWSGDVYIGEPGKVSKIAWFAPGNFPEKCVNVVRAFERFGAGTELSYSVTDSKGYAEIMGESLARNK